MVIEAASVLGLAEAQLGKKYVYGSAGPATFDCSGLMQFVFKPFGVNLPHHAADQAKLGTAVAVKDIRPGDLVFSDWGDGPNSHVGIAVSGSRIIDAPHTGAVVRYDTLSSSYLQHVTAVRRLGTDGAAPAGGGVAGGIGSAIGSVTGLDAIADAVKAAAAPLLSVGKLADQAFKIFMPSRFLRVAAGTVGLVLILWGVVLLAREARAF